RDQRGEGSVLGQDHRDLPAWIGARSAPGLSPPARAIKSPRHHRAYRSRPLMQEEIKALLKILEGMEPNDPDRPNVLDRVASDSFQDERDLYHDCMSILVMLQADRDPLSQLEPRLSEIRRRFLAARKRVRDLEEVGDRASNLCSPRALRSSPRRHPA